MAFKINDSKLKQILAEVAAEVDDLLKTETTTLSKAIGDEPEETPGEDHAPAEETPGEGGEGSSPAPAPEASEGAPADQSADPSAMAPTGSESADPAEQSGPIDPEALKAEYSQLPPEELKMHFLACKAALAEAMGGGQPEQAPEGTPPEGTPPAASPPMASPAEAAPQPPPALKSEMKSVPANGGKPEAVLGKSEDASKIEDLENQVEALTKAVKLSLEQPVRRAITSVAFLPRTEAEPEQAPSRAVIREKLSEVIRTKQLKKSDSDRIISYEMGSIGYEQIKDLLK